ncbi:DUF418 domain-containing protein [Bacillus sinesaloumensis]|uniref:DUF418 domain-containing protein n=1 Tax=Litchfieldia sinesaloumensis TaxID=1926280 RepID=UPI0009884B87|nr:DUF418 domain-containing protein [Bacillus sinesaloumensis]
MKKRVRLIDGLRGFSLIGILIANMLIFQFGMFGKDQMETYKALATDQASYIWIKVFIEGSFMPIFMFLFGYSMIKLSDKLQRSGKKVKRHLVRRFIILITFGLLHSFFVWEGDILFSYGLIGLFMIVFVKRKKKTILIWTISLFALFTSLGVIGATEEVEEPPNLHSYIQKEYDAYSNGGYWEAYDFRNSGEDPYGYPGYVYLIMLILMPLMVCPMFLFGMYTAKSGWFTHPSEEKGRYLTFVWIFLPIGLVLKTLPYLFPAYSWTESIYTIGAPLLSIGYIFLFAYFYTKEAFTLLTLFENVGRLSMTNYLTQSVICTIIFYGYGFGLFGELGVLNGILLGIVIYLAQILSSHYYLKIWKVGPFEKIMRVGTYLKWTGLSVLHESEGQIPHPTNRTLDKGVNS